MNPMLDRRTLLQAGIAASGLALKRPSRSRSLQQLVVIQLTGGNDSLSTVVPYADDAYRAARKTTLIDQPLVLDDRRGLHPALTRLRDRWDAGQLAIIEGVGYPEASRSHFKSLEIWHTGSTRGRAAGPGWIGGLAQTAEAGPWAGSRCGTVVHVGRKAPYSLKRERGAALVLESPSAYRWLGGARTSETAEVCAEMATASPRDHLLAAMRDVVDEAEESSKVLRHTIEAHEPAVAYPEEPFAASLRDLAGLVHAELGLRALSTTLTGFDTHSNQRQRHDGLMATFDAGLGAFLEDLALSEAGRSTAVLVYSEFGRRLAENGSNGTDHGLAGTAFLCGAPVRGGFHGETPSLTELQGGNPIHTTDFRSIFAAPVEGFGVAPEDVLDASHARLPDLLVT